MFSPVSQDPTASCEVVVAATMFPSAALVRLRAKKTPVASFTVAQPPRMAFAPVPKVLRVSVVMPLVALWLPPGRAKRTVPSWALMARVIAFRLRTRLWPLPGFSVMALLPPLPMVKLATVCALEAEALPVSTRFEPRMSRADAERSLVVLLAV